MKINPMKVLGIETSCDETAAAVVEGRAILSNVVASQHAVHAPFGGVVPELASRHHLEALPFVVNRALAEANLTLNDIDAVAATYAPGLLTALLVGLQYAKSLSFALNKPFVGVHHLEAHLHSVFLEHPRFDHPFLGLIVSGGHTHLYRVEGLGRYQLLGRTRDDAAGEAYDKVAKLLELGYPGGPRLDKLAGEGNKQAFRFTRPKMGQKMGNSSLDFSFSGIKTACLLQVQRQNGNLSSQFKKDMAASFQETVTDILIRRLDEALLRCGLKKIAVAGGVAANSELRKKLQRLGEEKNLVLAIPSMPLCTDNAAMIAFVGGLYAEEKKFTPLSQNAFATCDLHQPSPPL